MADELKLQLFDKSRRRIVMLLRTGGLTADDVARSLNLTRSAVRMQLTAMERDGIVWKTGKRPGATRPSIVFELTPEVEHLLSKAYMPLLTQLLDVFSESLPADQVEALLRRTGTGLAQQLTRDKQLSGSLASRVS